MNLIIPSAEVWNQHYIEEIDKDAILSNLWAHIARCTRVCYQSTPKNDCETDEEFVKRVILAHKPENSEANHLAMLEHGTVYLKYICKWVGNIFVKKYRNNKYSKVNSYPDKSLPHTNDGWVQDVFCITTNLRVLVENEWLDDLQYICSPTKYHIKRITVSFITNIGITREFNRHRVDSIAEESTRYCNYSKKNYGHLNIALPAWLNWNEQIINDGDFEKSGSGSEDSKVYIEALLHAEQAYNKLIELGWKPQQAREVLPLATKSQLIHTAFIDDWKHFFKLRAIGVSGAPHPNAKLVAVPLMEEFINKGLIDKSWLEEV